METPPDVLSKLAKQHGQVPTSHTLSQAERAKVLADLSMLPDFERRALQNKVRSISFVDGMGAVNGLTIVDDPKAPRSADITLNSILLTETVSQFLTRKERTCYGPSETHLDVSVEAGSLDAVLVALLHESMHAVDFIPNVGDAPPALAAGYWQNLKSRRPPYDSNLLGTNCFFRWSPLNINSAQEIYQALAQSPFASLYGATNWSDDSAELVAMYHLTHVLHQPYRIVLRSEEQTIVSLSPMDSPLVKARFPAVKALYP